MKRESFTVAGYEFELDKGTVERKLTRRHPEKVRVAYVHIHRQDFPVTQVLAESVPGLVRSRIKTQEAVRVLAKLGFTIREKR